MTIKSQRYTSVFLYISMASKNKGSNLLKIGIGLIAGTAAGYGIGKFMGGSGIDFVGKPSLWGVFLSIPVAFYLCIIVHELGHVLGGLIMGNDFVFVTAGPFKLSKEEGKLRFNINKHINLSGGLAMTLPKKVEGFRLRRFVVIFGGPLFSLLSAVGCYFVFKFSSSANGQVFFLLFGILSALIFVVTIVPRNVNGMMTDGYQLMMIFRNDIKAEKYADMLHLTALNQQGKSPAEYPPTILNKYQEGPIESPLDLAIHQFQYYKELAVENYDKAEHHINIVEENAAIYPTAFYPDVIAEPYFFYTMIRPDENKTKYLNSLMDGKVPRASALTANIYKGSKAYNEKDFQKANDFFEKVLTSKKDDGFTSLFKELIERYANKNTSLAT